MTHDEKEHVTQNDDEEDRELSADDIIKYKLTWCVTPEWRIKLERHRAQIFADRAEYRIVLDGRNKKRIAQKEAWPASDEGREAWRQFCKLSDRKQDREWERIGGKKRDMLRRVQFEEKIGRAIWSDEREEEKFIAREDRWLRKSEERGKRYDAEGKVFNLIGFEDEYEYEDELKYLRKKIDMRRKRAAIKNRKIRLNKYLAAHTDTQTAHNTN